MASVMKSIPLVTCTTLCPRNQRLISSSMSTMIKKFSDIQLVSTQKSQRMLIEDSSSHSTWLTILSQSLSQHRRTP